MAISLNNHESRIKALENSGLGSNYSGQDWCDLPGGLQLRFGRSGSLNGSPEKMYDVTLSKPFTHAGLYAYATFYPDDGNAGADMVSFANVISKSVIRYGLGFCNGAVRSGKVAWLAIGYLISDRILKYAYACKSLLFTPLRKLEV